MGNASTNAHNHSWDKHSSLVSCRSLHVYVSKESVEIYLFIFHILSNFFHRGVQLRKYVYYSATEIDENWRNLFSLMLLLALPPEYQPSRSKGKIRVKNKELKKRGYFGIKIEALKRNPYHDDAWLSFRCGANAVSFPSRVIHSCSIRPLHTFKHPSSFHVHTLFQMANAWIRFRVSGCRYKNLNNVFVSWSPSKWEYLIAQKRESDQRWWRNCIRVLTDVNHPEKISIDGSTHELYDFQLIVSSFRLAFFISIFSSYQNNSTIKHKSVVF